MLNVLPNVIALYGPYNSGGLTIIGYFLYLLYCSIFVIRVVSNRSRGKTFNVVHELLAFSAVYALVLVLFFVDPSNTHKTITDAIIYGFIWLGSLFVFRVILARVEKSAAPK